MLTACENKETTVISVDAHQTYQTMQGFGASAAWWAQDVGGWTEPTANGTPVREEIMTLLYGADGIGLDIYRYNLGAGSKAEDSSNYSDPWRKTQSFLTSSGAMDYTLDANAVWCMRRAVALGVQDVVFFSNSAPDTMTINGKTHGDADTSRVKSVNENGETEYHTFPNLDASQYQNFAEYVLDAVAFFRAEGIPIKTVSPINEPQWKWQGGQEGCHYEPEEVVAIYKVFLAEMQARGLADSLTLSMFESGQPFGDTLKRYLEPIADDDMLSAALQSLDTHSYWGTAEQKEKTARYLRWKYPKLAVQCTEWTEMTNGKDVAMDSALILAQTIYEDLTILDAESWSYWIAVSAYDYRDGLIYVDRAAHTYETTKRLYTLGNFSKFVAPGANRIRAKTAKDSPVTTLAFEDQGTITVIVINATQSAQPVDIRFKQDAAFSANSAFVTDATHDLAAVQLGAFQEDGVFAATVSAQSVTTFVFAE